MYRPICPSNDCDFGRRKDPKRQLKIEKDQVKQWWDEKLIRNVREQIIKDILEGETEDSLYRCTYCQRLYTFGKGHPVIFGFLD